jgi:hypothetical protein
MSFPFAYNTVMAVPGMNSDEATLRDEALRMITNGFSLHTHDRSSNEVVAWDERHEIHFRQTDFRQTCIVCGRDHSHGEGLWHIFDLNGNLLK